MNADTAPFETLAAEVDRVLRQAGYVRLQRLQIGEVPFEIEFAYLAGPRFLDLVLLMDAAAPVSHTYWLAERVASALDSVGSKRPLTYILAGSVDNLGVATDELIRLGRVVNVTGVDRAEAELAPLLPMVIEAGLDVEQDPLGSLDLGTGTSDSDAAALAAFVDAARTGAKSVEAGLANWFDAAFQAGSTA